MTKSPTRQNCETHRSFKAPTVSVSLSNPQKGHSSKSTHNLPYNFWLLVFSMAQNKKSQKADFDKLLKMTEFDVGKTLQERNHLPGTTFAPMDDELVMYYLFNKILGRYVPLTDPIKETELYKHDPDELPQSDYRFGTWRNEAFYFTCVAHIYTDQGKAVKRTTKGGYWEVTSEGKKVVLGNNDDDEDDNDGDKIVLGFKTTMYFNKGNIPASSVTAKSFIMHEFRLNPSIVPADVLNADIREKIDSLVVCKIFNKEKEARLRGPPTPEPEPYSDEEPERSSDEDAETR